jgi:hypothetical protein
MFFIIFFVTMNSPEAASVSTQESTTKDYMKKQQE